MLKRILMRGISGYCVTIAVTTVAGLISCLCGAKHACTPDFIARVGNEGAALYLQTLLMSLIGFAFGAGSIFFEIERWSFLKQGAAHLALTAAVWIIVELICFSPITPPLVFAFAVSAVATYTITWSIQYFVWRNQVRRLNKIIHEKNGGTFE